MSETPPNPVPVAPPLSESDQQLWSTIIHILGIFFQFLPALIGYLVLRDRGGFVRQHTRAALNFQLTMLIAYVVGSITAFFVIGLVILFAVGVVTIVFSIIAALAANRGESYEYPLAIKFVSN